MGHVLVTGGAGFIGSHFVDQLLSEGISVTCVDNFDPFYDPAIKRVNVRRHSNYPTYSFYCVDIRDLDALRLLPGDFDTVVHFAAMAGVRPSMLNPALYVDVNVRGTQNMLSLASERGVKHFVFASSSSVYGINPDVPWKEDSAVLLPISPYAGTKVSCELLGHVYSHLYGIRFVALRFFTVYGPRQRPDLAIHKFALLAMEGKALPIFGDGSTSRDYTYVGDIVAGVRAAMDYSKTPYEIFNLGNDRGISLFEMARTISDVYGCSPKFHYLPEQQGDVPVTLADIGKARRLLGYSPRTPFKEGVERFADWMQGQTHLVSSAGVGL